jgi:hypothetical protein
LSTRDAATIPNTRAIEFNDEKCGFTPTNAKLNIASFSFAVLF